MVILLILPKYVDIRVVSKQYLGYTCHLVLLYYNNKMFRYVFMGL